jgi:predicted CoA-binding protein
MPELKALVQEFLAQKKIAVVGVSDRRDTGSNANYRKFKKAGYQVYAINPRIQVFDGDPCYPDLKSLPERPDGVFVLAKPAVTEQIVRECVDLGIRRIWMHCLMGTKLGLAAGMSSVSPAALDLCRKNNIIVIPGSCPMQFLAPDFGHRMMRGLFGLMGNLKVD